MLANGRRALLLTGPWECERASPEKEINKGGERFDGKICNDSGLSLGEEVRL